MYRDYNFIPSVHSELRRMNDDDNLKCSVCQNEYAVKRRDPRLLHCLHALCEPCLKKERDPSHITCQVCNTDDVGKDGTPIDNVRLNELILYMAKHTPERLQCTNKADGRSGKMYCFDCNHFLCDQCESFHSQLEATRNHLSVYLGDLRSHPLTEWQTKQKCRAHPDYPVSFFCQETTCRKLICLYCHTKDHSGHKILEIDDAYDIEKENLKRLSNRLDAMISAQKDVMAKQKNAEIQRRKVSEAFEKMRSVVSQRHRYLLQILNYHYGEFHQAYNENMRDLTEKSDIVRSLYDQSMAFHTDPQYRELENSVPEGAENLAPKSPDSDLVFVQVGLGNLLREIQGFGNVNAVPTETPS